MGTDLVVVSVLSDSGAGPAWRYVTAAGDSLQASEGLATASVDLFLDGFFSSDAAMKPRVNSLALKQLTDEALSRGLQVSRSNPSLAFPGEPECYVLWERQWS